jgi:hypothetical protein
VSTKRSQRQQATPRSDGRESQTHVHARSQAPEHRTLSSVVFALTRSASASCASNTPSAVSCVAARIQTGT